MPTSALRRIARRLRGPGKEDAELEYWRRRAEAEGGLTGPHYERLFTTHFGLSASDFAGRRVLDVGCGPRGSLEWATEAADRVGLDPLVPRYRELGIDRHAMRYVAGPAERMPFPDGSFDVVASLNSLDHVDDVDRAIAEMTRVAVSGALGLVLVEVGHAPTATEPQALDWQVLDRFSGWDVEWTARNGVRPDHQLYASIEEGLPHTGGPGIVRARLRRR